MKLRTKLWLLVVTSIVLSLTLFIVLSVWIGQKYNQGYSLNSLDNIISTTIRQMQDEQAFAKDRVQPILDNAHQQDPQLRFEWIASDGIPIYDTSGQSIPYSFKELADRVTHLPTNLWTDGEQITLAASTDKDGQSYYLLVSLPSEAMEPGQFYFFMRTYKILFTLALPLLLAFLTPYLLSLWFFSSMNRRLRKLNVALNRVNLQSEDIELQDNAKDEISQLNMHYNQMTRRIRMQITQIEQFESRRKVLLSNLSHDLRTPLTMILGYAETIRVEHYKDTRELKSSVKIILQHSRYMESLLNQILDVSRQGVDVRNIRFVHEDLSELIRKVVADYLLIIDEDNLNLDFNIPETELVVPMDVLLIERALRNLLDNALRYGNEGRYLGVQLTEEEETAIITITDKGKGVNPEDRDYIFDRFYRSGGRVGQGLGMGLSIVKDVAEAHQGSVEMSSIPYQETAFQIRLPK
ncbi:HAMP domain-containing sensor histidine kinase [Paenibacillus agricola]|uniref:histidine kinase n=1 Tax=Paenibacillus agricola TaxID=2716264 RepID=A0ABX0JAU5_9BACL|nr:HAMP domain-containing sensor histidine kinase [Paenibacillus agricola]NHN33068.1 HAMP domain-containing histidine kinase [Paenibacillus agricola]